MLIPVTTIPTLTPDQEQAAYETAQGRSAQKIADELKVARKTIERWRQMPTFVARVKQHQEETFRQIRAKGVAVIELRVRARQRRLNALYSIANKRKGDPKCGGAEWDDTGLVLRKDKMLGGGDTALLVEEFELDTGMLQAMFQLEEGIATDLGQRRHKMDVNITDKPPLLPAAIEMAKKLTAEELQDRLNKLDQIIDELTRNPAVVESTLVESTPVQRP